MLEELRLFANQLANASEEIIRPRFRQTFDVNHKGDSTPVTDADRLAEQTMRDLIQQTYPEHAVVGEEFANTGSDQCEYKWILDPIDGTKSFVIGSPLFGTLIGLMHQSKPIIGVINQPILKERWVGSQAAGTLFNGKQCFTRATESLSAARFSYTSPHMFNPAEIAKLNQLSQRVAQTTFGGDCYAYGLLASGHVDIIIEASLHPFDYMALLPVIEGAGGVITDWFGQALTLESDGRVVACSNKIIHQQVLAYLT